MENVSRALRLHPHLDGEGKTGNIKDKVIAELFSQESNTRLEWTGTSPGIWKLDYGLWNLDFFYEDDLGLQTGSYSITKTLKTFL